MFKKTAIAGLLFSLCLTLFPSSAQAETAGTRLSGRILLQVEENGEAWYVDQAGARTYLGRPEDALAVMQERGLGISNRDLGSFRAVAPKRLAGRILLAVEKEGQAYYVDPDSRRLFALGRPEEAFKIMRERGLGISNQDIKKIPIKGSEPGGPSDVSDSLAGIDLPAIERKAFAAVNEYRLSLGLGALLIDERIASVARAHSANMAAGRVPFGHDGFSERFGELSPSTGAKAMAENVAYNSNASDPAKKALEQWINSEGHRLYMLGDYTAAGIGLARAGSLYYFTQIFAR
ncbi:MAG: CAP domain-containing protein [Candidatus Falkowbacteria bacterium]